MPVIEGAGGVVTDWRGRRLPGRRRRARLRRPGAARRTAAPHRCARLKRGPAVRLLLLGGTRFLGRHVAEEALARGHAVTLFTRGRTPQPFGDRVRAARRRPRPARRSRPRRCGGRRVGRGDRHLGLRAARGRRVRDAACAACRPLRVHLLALRAREARSARARRVCAGGHPCGSRDRGRTAQLWWTQGRLRGRRAATRTATARRSCGRA